MKPWSRKHTLIVGLGILAGTNAVALLGVYGNRHGEPEALLNLSEREVGLPFRWAGRDENSGLALSIEWRIPQTPVTDGTDADDLNLVYSAAIPWLDEAKMVSLGFDALSKSRLTDDIRETQRQTSREVFLVLELDGPAYQAALARAQAVFALQSRRVTEATDPEKLAERRREAQERLYGEKHKRSRLFAVDAGRDAAALRRTYPNRHQYAIVRAKIEPAWRPSGSRELTGMISSLSVDEIMVPFAFRPLAEALSQNKSDEREPFVATVAYGRRLEPWLVGFSKPQ